MHFYGITSANEDQYYTRILNAWHGATLSQKDVDTLLSRLLIDIMERDRVCDRAKHPALPRILTNCIILVLALFHGTSYGIEGENDLENLPEDLQETVRAELSSHFT